MPRTFKPHLHSDWIISQLSFNTLISKIPANHIHPCGQSFHGQTFHRIIDAPKNLPFNHISSLFKSFHSNIPTFYIPYQLLESGSLISSEMSIDDLRLFLNCSTAAIKSNIQRHLIPSFRKNTSNHGGNKAHFFSKHDIEWFLLNLHSENGKKRVIFYEHEDGKREKLYYVKSSPLNV